MTNLEFINAYKDMKKLGEMCKDENINYSNLVNGKCKSEVELDMAVKCKFEIIRMYGEVMKTNVKTDSL